MGRDRRYIPGDFYRIDDRTGFPERAKRQFKEWTGLIVHRDRWEARQPQDFVKGVRDEQGAYNPRPLSTIDIFVSLQGYFTEESTVSDIDYYTSEEGGIDIYIPES